MANLSVNSKIVSNVGFVAMSDAWVESNLIFVYVYHLTCALTVDLKEPAEFVAMIL